MILRVLVLGPLAGPLTGCFLVRGPQQGVPSDQLLCTRGYTLPLIDGGAGVLGVVAAIGLASEENSEYSPGFVSTGSGDRTPALVSALGAVYLASSVVGALRVRDCRRALLPITARRGPEAPRFGDARRGPVRARPDLFPVRRSGGR